MNISKLGVDFKGAQVEYQQQEALQNKQLQDQKNIQQLAFEEQKRQYEQKLLGQREVFRRIEKEKIRLENLERYGGDSNPNLMIASSAPFTSPVPTGAKGPFHTKAPGMEYKDGDGGVGVPKNATQLRIMDDNSAKTGNIHHRQRSIYSNILDQPLNPTTGNPDTAEKTHLYHVQRKDK